MRRPITRTQVLVGTLFLFNGVIAVASQQPPAYTLERIGPAGSVYEAQYNGGMYRADIVGKVNAAGQVFGNTTRLASATLSLGNDAWLWSDGATRLIGLTGPGYEYAHQSGGIYRSDFASQLNQSGQVIGSTRRYVAGTSTPNGQDAWLYSNGTTSVIGLSGTEYEYASSAQTLAHASDVKELNESGQVMGDTQRYSANGSGIGQDAWLYINGTTKLIGLTGPGYDFAANGGIGRMTFAFDLNASGEAVGETDRFDPATSTTRGQDAWLYSGGVTQLIGLTGTGYQYVFGGSIARDSTAAQINNAGSVLGWSNRFSSGGVERGRDAWLYHAGTTTTLGLTGGRYEYAASGGTYRYSNGTGMNEAGMVCGYSRRFSTVGADLGQDMWFFDGSISAAVNLTGGAYEYAKNGSTYRYAESYVLSEAGDMVGMSKRFTAAGADLGRDAWVHHRGGQTVAINPVGSGFEYTASGGTYRYGESGYAILSGDVAGQSKRFGSTGADLGQVAWYYDADSGVTTPLLFSLRDDGYALSSLRVLRDDGTVLGSYELYSGMNDLGSRAFWWNPESGFYDLGALVAGGLSALQWQSLGAVNGAGGVTAAGAPRYLAGWGLIDGQSGGGIAYLMSANVPEVSPLAGALVTIAGGLGIRRQRR